MFVLSYSGSNTSFMLQADGTGGNRIFDGLSESHVDGTFHINDPTDPTASFRNGDSSMLQCPGNNCMRPSSVLDKEPLQRVLMQNGILTGSQLSIKN